MTSCRTLDYLKRAERCGCPPQRNSPTEYAAIKEKTEATLLSDKSGPNRTTDVLNLAGDHSISDE